MKGQNNKKALRGIKKMLRGSKKHRSSGPQVQRVIPVAYVAKPKRSSLPAASAGWQKCSFFMGQFDSSRKSARVVLNPGLWRAYKDAEGTVDYDKTKQFAIPAIWQAEFFRMQKYQMRNLTFTFTPEHGTAAGSNIILRYRSDSSESDGNFSVPTNAKPWLNNHLQGLPELTDILAKAGSGLYGPYTSMTGVKTIKVGMKASGVKRLRFFNENHPQYTSEAEAKLEKNYADPTYVPTAEEALMDYGVVEFAVSGIDPHAYKYYVTCEFEVKLTEWTSTNHAHPTDYHPSGIGAAARGIVMANHYEYPNLGYYTLHNTTGQPTELPWNNKVTDSIFPSGWELHNASTAAATFRRFVPKTPGAYTFKVAGGVEHSVYAEADWRDFQNQVRLSLSKWYDSTPKTTQFVPVGDSILFRSTIREKSVKLGFTYPWLVLVSQADVDAGAQFHIEYTCYRATGPGTTNQGYSRIKLHSIEVEPFPEGSQYKSVLHVDIVQTIASGVSEHVARDLYIEPSTDEVEDESPVTAVPDDWEDEGVVVQNEIDSSEAPSLDDEEAGVYQTPPSPIPVKGQQCAPLDKPRRK